METHSLINLNYYTPEKEDLFIGYECEILYQSDNKLARTENYKWHKVKLDLNMFQKAVSPTFFKTGKVRTAFLTKEAIINEGWSAPEWADKMAATYLEKGDYSVVSNCFPHMIDHLMIDKKSDKPELHGPSGKSIIYNGKIKGINEFRKLVKMASITE